MNRYRNFIYTVTMWIAFLTLPVLFPKQAVAWNLVVVGPGTVTIAGATYGPGTSPLSLSKGDYSLTLTPALQAKVISASAECIVNIPPSGSSVPVSGTLRIAKYTSGVTVTFSAVQVTYTVTVNCIGGGTVDGGNTTESVTLNYHDSKTFNFDVPDQTYVYDSLIVNNVEVDKKGNPTPPWSYPVENIEADVTITAKFSKLFRITASSTTPSWGAISPSGSALYRADAQQTFVFTPATGYGVQSVTVDGASVAWTRGNGDSYTFSNPLTRDSSIAATFAPAYIINASAGSGGKIFPNGIISVVTGQSQSFSFIPSDGFVVSQVTVDGYARGAVSSYTFPNVAGNHWIKADFIKAGASMHSYCTVPPYVASYKPNVLLLLDNSSSMGDLAYTSADSASYCFDDSFSSGKTYVGYFDQTQWYRYDTAAGGFLPVGSVTGACAAASTSYLCINFSGASSPRTVDNFIARGNFLNWLAMSKIDVEKYVLTGGKRDAVSGMLQAESRGCQGKRFLKVASGAGSVTFAVRGPAADESDYAFGGTGATRIEIYDGSYKDSCRALAGDWSGSGIDKLKTDLSACFDNDKDLLNGNQVSSKASIYNLVITDCFTSMAQNTKFPDDDMKTLEDKCLERYKSVYGNDLTLVRGTRLDDGVCGSGMSHQLTNGNTLGFFGKCYVNAWDTRCTGDEADDYCKGVVTGYLQDPSATAFMAGTRANIPGFFVDAGVSSLGSPSGKFMVRLPLPAESRGIVQEFADGLNLGVMVFNDSGNASECSKSGGPVLCTSSCKNSHSPCASSDDCLSGDTCIADPLKDGGKILSYIGDVIGDHTTTGIVSAIDEIRASSWTPIAESFYNAIGYFANRTDLRLPLPGTEEAWDSTRPPSQSDCQKNHILIVSDGMSTADQNSDMERLAARYAANSGGAGGFDTANNCPAYSGSRSLRVLGWLAKNRNIKTFSTSSASDQPPGKNSEFITTHAIFTGTASGAPGDCDAATLLQNTVDPSGHEKVINAADPALLYDAFRNVLLQIAAGSKTGTDATILTTGRGNGAVLLQEFFYPQKTFDNGSSSASWIGEMQGLWYSIDSFVGASGGGGSTVRDDAGYTGGIHHSLNVSSDHVVQYSYAPGTNGDHVLQATLSDGSGTTQTVAPEAVQSLWRAGAKLWQRDPSDRTIYTETDGSLFRFTNLDVSQSSVRSLLQAADANEANNIISYIAGNDFTQYRNRTISYPPLGSGKKVWKLGDIISSTPRVQSSTALNSYHLSPSRGYADQSYGDIFSGRGFTDLSTYKNRGMVYVGANDGMLHAFQFGLLSATSSEPDKATLTGADLGREEWAFIPKNALPYLKYLADPQYPHLSYVDGGLTLFDAAIGDPAEDSCDRNQYWKCLKQTIPATESTPARSSWRTVLIGGMGFGGASRPFGDSCDDTSSGSCVKSPAAGAGLSSYFALDVTGETFDPVSGTRNATTPPRLLWEFSDSDLGFSTSGAAIIRIADYEGTPPQT